LGGLGGVGFEGGALEVGAGGLECVEDEAALTFGDACADHGVNGFHEADLDGVGVLEDGNVEAVMAGWEGAGSLLGGAAAFAGFVVEVTEASVTQSGRSAGLSVDLEVLTKWYCRHDPSPPPLILSNQQVRLEMRDKYFGMW
jgi:hypothetical protein